MNRKAENVERVHTGNLKEKKNKNIKGITLVALVITIVILLILAGVGIQAITNIGLFNKAKEARQKSENAQAEENGTLSNYEDNINKIIEAEENINVKESIEKIWSISDSNVDYTYTVEKKGKYLVGIMNSNYQSAAGSITTNATETLSKNISVCSSYTRFSTVKIIEANKGDIINVKGYNAYCDSNAFISKLNNINVKEIIDCGISSDGTIQKTYTAGNKGEKLLVIAFANGDNSRKASTTYSSGQTISSLMDNCDYIDYIYLDANAELKTSAYGYNWGGGSIYILK